MSKQLTVTKPVSNEGSVVVLAGEDEDGTTWYFAADHRPAWAIVEALEAGEDVEVEVEEWQLMGRES